MSLDMDTIDRVKTAVANTLSWELGDDGKETAAVVLAEIDKALADPANPEPFTVGSRVTVKGTDIAGVVLRRVVTHGELHTVAVKLDLETVTGERLFSPRELVQADA